MDSTFYEVSLAGLIHDVGKVGQRAFQTDKGLSGQSLNMENMICPKDSKSGLHTYRHVLYTNEFCEYISKLLPQDLHPGQVANLASYHHNPNKDNSLQHIIQEADILSAAMERLPEESSDSNFRLAFRRIHLRAITSQVLQDTVKNRWCFQLVPLEGDMKIIFPVELEEEERDLHAEYRILWDGLRNAWSRNRLRDPWQYINRGLALLEPFTWCVPSATNVRPDISLFDHLKTTSAIAGCLYRCPNHEKPFLLVVGDYGGIQSYLYDLSHGAGKITKSLRGRSFYVRMLAECVSLKILCETGCPATHRILQAGGRFYLLLPNDEPTLQVLDKTVLELDQWILQQKNGELRFSLGWTEMGKKELWDRDTEGSNFPIAKERADEALSLQKQKPLQRVFFLDADTFLRPELILVGEQALCDSCGRNPADPIREDEETHYICPSCLRDREEGRRLTNAKFVSFIETGASVARLPFFDYALLDDATRISESTFTLLSFGAVQNADSNAPLLPFRQARYVPRDADGDVLEFNEIAGGKDAEGRKALGFLKADVDNLGMIFRHGFKRAGEKSKHPDQSEASISRLATLSRMLELFFSTYFEQFLREQYPDVYLVYSGGDDLLAIGPWKRIFDLALDLRREFREFTCRNPHWGLSAGICVVNPKTPVLQAVEMADSCLEKSKEITGKDACTAFGTTLKWEDYEAALNQAHKVLNWLQEDVLNPGKVRRLLNYAETYRNRDENEDKNAFLRYVPQLIYDLKRNWRGFDPDDSPQQQESLRWAQSLANPDANEIKQLYFICQYALNGVRS